MKSIVLLVVLGAVICEITGTVVNNHLKYKEDVDDAEDDISIENFKENLRKSQEHNEMMHHKNETYETSLNEFAMLSHEEFIRHYLNDKLNETRPNSTAEDVPPTTQNDFKRIPDKFDWRSFGLVTSVKSQGSCGTCWSFTNVGAVETIYANKYGKLIELSNQDLNDCLKSGQYKNWGCNGGYPSNGFYYAYSKGLVEESVVPYRVRDGLCNKNLHTKRFKITGYANIPYGDEEAIKVAVATYGPVTIAIDASEWGFAYYSHGIYSSYKCQKDLHNHAVLIVGYGSENGIDYWIIKNSWGPSWGVNGYMKLARNKNNMCGVASMASYAYM